MTENLLQLSTACLSLEDDENDDSYEEFADYYQDHSYEVEILPLIHYCYYADEIVAKLSSKIVKLMKDKIKLDNSSKHTGGRCCLVAYGDSGCLKREIVTKSVEDANFNLIEWDSGITKEPTWLESLVTRAKQNTPAVILVTCDDLKSTTPNEEGKEAAHFIVKELQKLLKEEVFLIITSEEPTNVPFSWRKLVLDSFLYVRGPTDIERREIIKNIVEIRGIMKKSSRIISDSVVYKVACKTKNLSVREMFSATLNLYDEASKQHNEVMKRVRNKRVNKAKTGWDTIQGYEATKAAIKSVVDQYRRDPENHSFEGLLLYGPPGCSKTLFVRALVAESGFPLFCGRASDYLSKYVGETEKNLRELFRSALRNAPSILFFDELDELCRSRNKSESQGYLISEMKEFMEQCVVNRVRKVFLIGATNKPSVIDKSLLGKSFFSQMLHIDLPTCDDRCAMWQHRIDNAPTRGTMDAKALCEASKGFSGAEIHGAYTDAATKVKRKRYEPALKAHLESLGMSPLMAGMVKKPQSVLDCIYFTQEELLQSVKDIVPQTDYSFVKESRDFSNLYKESQLDIKVTAN